MSKNNLICFDASVKNGLVEIGIWNFTRKEKVYKTYTNKLKNHESFVAETMALVVAMEYAHENNIKSPHLFTDNMQLAQNGIPENFIKKFGYATLNWIPREFNLEADKLSKKGRDVNTIPLESLTIPKTASGSDLKSLCIHIGNYDKERKMNLLRRLAINDFQMTLVDFFEGNIEKVSGKSNNDIQFIRFCRSILRKGDTKPKQKKQWNKIMGGCNAGMTDKQIERFVREGNLI